MTLAVEDFWRSFEETFGSYASKDEYNIQLRDSTMDLIQFAEGVVISSFSAWFTGWLWELALKDYLNANSK